MDVGVIGVGSMGKNHVRVYSELKSVSTLAIYDTNRDVAKEVAKQHGAEYFETLQHLLNRVDVVSVCVPTPYHASVVKKVFVAEKHILIEKPICLTYIEGMELIVKMPPTIIVGVGHIERFNPVISELCKIIKNPLYIEMKRHNPASARVTGSSVVDDLMIHDIDILKNAFLLSPTELYSIGNDDVCNVSMMCGSIPVILSASRKSSKKCRSIYIEEEDFTVEGNLMSQEVTIYRKPGKYHIEAERYVQENIIEKVMVNKLEPLRVELNTFIDCAKSGKPFPITTGQAVRNLKLCEQIKKTTGGVG